MTSPVYSQVHRYKDTFPNGQLKYNGKYIICVTQDDHFPYIFNHEKRKIGKWIAYYPSGIIKEIREYTKKDRNCDTAILKEGEWKYFNEDGIQYLSQRYSNDTLIYSEIDIYQEKSLVSKMIVTDHSRDTLFYSNNKKTNNLIRNPSFDQYFYKPFTIINDGQDQIERLIPYWYSPDKSTADYYNQYRKVKGIPEHLNSEFEVDHNGYVGLMLFLSKKRKDQISTDFKNEYDYQIDYTENIQSKLITKLSRGNTYCFKAKIILSKNSGYSINRFGVLFSKESIQFSYSKSPVEPTLSFTDVMNNSNNWYTLCKGFTAVGNEEYITLGRFSKQEEININPHIPNQSSELDINRSAYYLIDDTQLYRVDSLSVCGCNTNISGRSNLKKHNNFAEINLDSTLSMGSKFVLSNINFDIDKADIKDAFIQELNRLLNYLEWNPSMQIIIYGHTDNKGTELYNKNLSRARAKAIKEWLVRNGIEDKRIKYKGVGDSMPLVENISEENREINRRVEIQIVTE